MLASAIGGYARVSDTRIYYEIYGEGAPVLLLHGNGENLHTFDALIPTLAERYRVIALDTRGHGKSGRGTKPFRFETFADDVFEAMKILELEPARVIGYSDGGSTAMHLALRYPQCVGRLLLLGANLNPKGVEVRFQAPVVMGYLACKAIARVSRKAEGKRELLELMVKHPQLTVEQVGRIGAPALVLAGEKDIIKSTHTMEIAEAIPGARMEIIPGADHFTLVKARQTANAIMQFLDEER